MQLASVNPVRLLAVVGVAAALAGGMIVFKSARGGGSNASTSQPTLLHTSVGHRAHRAKRHTVHKTVKAHPRPARPVAANGLPRAVAVALVRHPVVVVAVVAPRGAVDDVAAKEAQAGATAAHAGFVRVNAFRQSQIAPLQAKLGIKDNPALLVLTRPTTVVFQVSGFVDRATVVQAVADARAAVASS
jgi:hypothetical protein